MSMHQTAPSEAEAAEDTSGLRRGSPAPAAAAMGPPPDGGPPGRPALEVTVESFDDGQPQPRCVVYMDLTREECSRLFPSGRAHSQPFRFAGQGFFLTACCGMDLHRSSDHCFGLFLAMQKESAGSSAAAGVVTTVVDYDFAARTTTSSSGEFVSRYSGCYSFAGGKAVGYRNLFGTPWPAFMADDSEFFVDGVLHLRAELCVKQP